MRMSCTFASIRINAVQHLTQCLTQSGPSLNGHYMGGASGQASFLQFCSITCTGADTAEQEGDTSVALRQITAQCLSPDFLGQGAKRAGRQARALEEEVTGHV